MNEGIWILALLGKVFGRGNDHVNRQDEFLANRQANGVAALWPVVQGFEDDEQVYVAVRAGVAASMATEENDLFGIEFLGDQLGYGADGGLVDCGNAHLRRSFCSGSAKLLSETVLPGPRRL